MDRPNRRPTTDVIDRLLDRPRGFGVVQALRLLRHHLIHMDPDAAWASQVRLRPELSLDFPGSDIVGIEKTGGEDHPTFDLTVSFLGLYGTASPLPTYYTEALLDEAQQDGSLLRDFIDVVQQPIYRLFYDVWRHYRWPQQIIEEKDAHAENRLLALSGRGLESLRQDRPEAVSQLRYLGLFTQTPRSALGLRTLLRDALGLPRLTVHACVISWQPLPADQRTHLGGQACQLGETSYLGRRFMDAGSTFAIDLGIVDLTLWQSLAPGREGDQRLRELCRDYLLQPLMPRIRATIRDEQTTTACLSGPLNRLGQDCWLFSGPPPTEGLRANDY